MLRINIERDSRSATLHCHGRIVFGMEIETLRSITMSRRERALEINLAGVETVDASGLGLLVELQRWASVAGRSLQFTNASPFVGRLVVLTHLYSVLAIVPAAGYAAVEQVAAALSA
jgi:anti-anti-sigma factor